MSEGTPPERLLDRAHLETQTGGDRALAAELLALFAEQCRRLLPGLLDRSADAAERADLAHTLKGSALGVGAGPVATAAAEVEDGLRGVKDDGRAIAALAAVVEATLAALDDQG